MLSTQLFVGNNLELDYYDLEKDPCREAIFTTDPDYFWGMDNDAFPRPLTSFELKKKREEQLKAVSEKGNTYLFALRKKGEDSFLGVLIFPFILWNSRSGSMQVLMPASNEYSHFFEEALSMGLRYAFEELDLMEVTINTGDFQPHIMETLFKAGLHQAVQMREAVYRNGSLFDKIIMEMMQGEWQLRIGEDHHE